MNDDSSGVNETNDPSEGTMEVEDNPENDPNEGTIEVEGHPEGVVVDADEVFLLMHPDVRVSRNSRAYWYICNLNQTVRIGSVDKFWNQKDELEVIGCKSQDPDVCSSTYKLTPNTIVKFLSHRYSFVYLIDLTASSGAVNATENCSSTSIEAALMALRNSLDGFSRPFQVPGNSKDLEFVPAVFVTVIAWNSFLTVDCQMVLCHGWCLRNDNIDDLMSVISDKLKRVENSVVQANGIIHSDIENIRLESEKIMGGLFETSSHPPMTSPSIPVSPADISFVNMIRIGILALELLPKYSTTGIIVISDGSVSMPDVDMCDSLLNQLKTKTISLSFLLASSPPSPKSAFARVPYADLLNYLACSTFGTFLSKVDEAANDNQMNKYHEAFLVWSFRKALMQQEEAKSDCKWEMSNIFFNFFDESDKNLKKRNQAEVLSSLVSLMSCRLREGFTLNEVHVLANFIEMKLSLPWNRSSLIHYIVQSRWPNGCNQEEKCLVSIYLEGDYDILHDITCQSDKKHLSKDRNLVILKFYSIVQHLMRVDKLLIHLESFPSNKTFSIIPDGLHKGMPLFMLNHQSPIPEPYQADLASPNFLAFWKPVCSLDINIWHRWMHTHRISLILAHDNNYPKHFMHPNASGRFAPVQSRKTFSKITNMLKEFSTFSLVENTSYIKFLYKDSDPVNFYILRVTSKQPCVILWLAFPLGTSADTRHQELKLVREKLKTLVVEHRLPWTGDLSKMQPQRDHEEIPACVLLIKPIEKIMVRYSKIPKDFNHLLDPFFLDLFPHFGNSQLLSSNNFGSQLRSSSGAFMTLAKYLQHNRWIWELHEGRYDLSLSFVARLLLTLIKMRLKQGFQFAHSINGVQTLLLEVPVKSYPIPIEGEKNQQTMVIQFVTFPPNREECLCEDFSDDGADMASSVSHESKTQIITETWVEPQRGVIVSDRPETRDFADLTYKNVAEKILSVDRDIIKTMASLEYITGLCQERILPILGGVSRAKEKSQKQNQSASVWKISVGYDLVSLIEKSPQIEILLSCLIQDLVFIKEDNSRDRCSMEQNKNNSNFLEILHAEFGVEFDKVISLSDAECADFLTHLLKSHPKRKHFTHLYHNPNEAPPKWKCYVKQFIGNYFLMTLIPVSFSDVKSLMLNNENDLEKNKQVKLSRKPMPIAKPRFPIDTPISDGSNATSSTSPSELTRKRTQSIDNSDTPGTGRRRQSISGSDIVSNNGSKGVERGRFRPRTNTFSHMNRGGLERHVGGRGRGQQITRDNIEANTKEMAMLARQIEVRIKRVGSIALPVFTYECHEHDLTEIILDKLEQSSSVTINLQARHEVEDKSDDESSDNLEMLIGPSKVPHFNTWKIKHVTAVQRMYMKSFVTIIFQALWNNIPVHPYDIQKAIDFCENEVVRNVNINQFLRTTCNYREDKDSRNLEDLSLPNHICDDKTNHSFIKKKFDDLLQINFEHVPGHEDLFYFKPESPGSGLRSISSRQRRDTKDTTASSSYAEEDIIEFKSISGRPEDGLSCKILSGVATPSANNGSLSMLSNVESEQADSNFSQDEQEDPDKQELFPLFLQISISLRSGDKSLENFPISELPTCLWKVLQDAEMPNSKDVSIFVDFLTMTLPPDEKEDKQTIPHAGSMGSNLSMPQSPIPMTSAIEDDEEASNSDGIPDEDHRAHLPEVQKKAVEYMVEELRWMVKNEIVSAKAKKSSVQVDADVLNEVMEHIEQSVDKPGCSLQRIPLSFVFGQAKSFLEFSKKLDTLQLSDFDLKRVGKELIFFIPSDTDGTRMYWLILKVTEDELLIFFQYREGQLSDVLPWRKAQLRLVSKLKDFIKWTNQYLLLQDLHENRHCNRLLEGESEEEAWPVEDFDQQTLLEANLKFKPGHFSCPMVWDTKIKLHPRLVQMQSHESTSLGLIALKKSLTAFIVTNRNNMYVYMDDKKDVYYFKLFEFVSLGPQAPKPKEDGAKDILSRSSSSSSLSGGTRTTNQDSDQLSTSRTSFKSCKGDHIGIQFFGVNQPTANLQDELIDFFQAKLDEHLVDLLSILLQRNPMSKLSIHDVAFIQKASAFPEHVVRIDVDNSLIPFLDMLLYFLRQNLLNGFLSPPKYHHVRGNGFKKNSSDVTSEAFVYNHCVLHVAHRGLACVLMDILNKDRAPMDQNNLSKIIMSNICTVGNIHNEKETFLELKTNFDDDQDFAIEFSMCSQGRMDVDRVLGKLETAVRHSVWETKLEIFLLKQPVATEEEGVVRLQQGFLHLIEKWIPVGTEEEVPSLFQSDVVIHTRCRMSVLLSEVVELVKGQFPHTEPYVFNKRCDNNHELISQFPDSDQPDNCKFTLVVKPDCSQASNLPLHNILRFKPMNYGRESSVPQTPTAPSPVGSFYQGLSAAGTGEDQEYVPRQCLLIVCVTSASVFITSYNLQKSINESLVRLTSQSIDWLCSRENLARSVAFQKLGLFHNQPLIRHAKSSNLLSSKIEQLVHNVRCPPAHQAKEAGKKDASVLFMFKDKKPNPPMKKSSAKLYDYTNVHGSQLFQLSHSLDEKLSRLFHFWQKRGGDSLTKEGIEFLKSNSRLMHFCETPLLFLPRWRLMANWTRNSDDTRTTEDSNTEVMMNRMFRRSNEDERDNENLIRIFIQEFCQYVLALGFLLVKTRNISRTEQKFFQKPVPNGIMLLECGITQPFFYIKLYILEATRLTRMSDRKNPSTVLIDEVDKFKSTIHLHSFAHDFHLRILQGCVSQSMTHLRNGYNIVKFLSDFFKYYSKGPNFARNMMNSGRFRIQCPQVSPIILFNYVLSHEKNYNFRVIRLEPIMVNNTDESFDCEFALTRVQQHRLSVSFPTDLKKTDDFDATLVISLNRSESTDDDLVLDYFILLTGRKIIFPPLTCEQPNIGKFERVHEVLPTKSSPPVNEQNPWPFEQEKVIYLGYFSSHEQWLQSVMNWQQRMTDDSLSCTFSNALIDCRRDSLWSKMLNLDEEMDFSLFMELISKSFTTNLPEVSENFQLCPRKNETFQWKADMLSSLKKKYPNHHRSYESDEHPSKIFFTIFDPKRAAHFVLIVINKIGFHPCQDFLLVSKEAEQLNLQNCNFVREVTSAISYHVWSGCVRIL